MTLARHVWLSTSDTLGASIKTVLGEVEAQRIGEEAAAMLVKYHARVLDKSIGLDDARRRIWERGGGTEGQFAGCRVVYVLSLDQDASLVGFVKYLQTSNEVFLEETHRLETVAGHELLCQMLVQSLPLLVEDINTFPDLHLCLQVHEANKRARRLYEAGLGMTVEGGREAAQHVFLSKAASLVQAAARSRLNSKTQPPEGEKRFLIASYCELEEGRDPSCDDGLSQQQPSSEPQQQPTAEPTSEKYPPGSLERWIKGTDTFDGNYDRLPRATSRNDR